MVRFQPDTWLEALLRPVAMAAPDANVYVEIMAPDFRFVFAMAMLALLGLTSLRARRTRTTRPDGAREMASRRPVFVLLAAIAVAFVPWLVTTGNGRYFVVGLLLVGPVCVGLVSLLPVTRACRLALAAGIVALQVFAVQQSAPWNAWTMTEWSQPPYFHVEVPPDVRAEPATYVTMAAISYSLIAPLFHPHSRWMSLHNAPAPGGGSLDARRTEAFLSEPQAGRLMLLVPAIAGALTAERLPNPRVSEVIGHQLARYRLGFTQPQACRFLPSRALADMGLGAKTQEQRAQSGFWLCRLMRLDAAAPSEASRGKRYGAVFERLEAQCPRLFPAGGDNGSLLLPQGEMRSYLRGEMKAYVYDSGEVYYKYYRSLNPVLVGNVDDVVAGRSGVDCSRIRGRTGLPWEREI